MLNSEINAKIILVGYYDKHCSENNIEKDMSIFLARKDYFLNVLCFKIVTMAAIFKLWLCGCIYSTLEVGALFCILITTAEINN